MAAMGLRHYRFSLAWPRLMPDGTPASWNAEGVAFYHRLLDLLDAAGIEVRPPRAIAARRGPRVERSRSRSPRPARSLVVAAPSERERPAPASLPPRRPTSGWQKNLTAETCEESDRRGCTPRACRESAWWTGPRRSRSPLLAQNRDSLAPSSPSWRSSPTLRSTHASFSTPPPPRASCASRWPGFVSPRPDWPRFVSPPPENRTTRAADHALPLGPAARARRGRRLAREGRDRALVRRLRRSRLRRVWRARVGAALDHLQRAAHVHSAGRSWWRRWRFVVAGAGLATGAERIGGALMGGRARAARRGRAVGPGERTLARVARC